MAAWYRRSAFSAVTCRHQLRVHSTKREHDLGEVNVQGRPERCDHLDVQQWYVNTVSISLSHSAACRCADLLEHVIFKRDGENQLRGKCKMCRSGRCCVYRVRKDCNPAPQSPSRSDTEKQGSPIEHVCFCGHSNFHHELIDESSTSDCTVQVVCEEIANAVVVLVVFLLQSSSARSPWTRRRRKVRACCSADCLVHEGMRALTRDPVVCAFQC